MISPVSRKSFSKSPLWSLSGRLLSRYAAALWIGFCALLSSVAYAQTGTSTSPCTTAGLPPPSGTNSGNASITQCAPAEWRISYGVAYDVNAVPTIPTGTYAYVFKWGDGSQNGVVSLSNPDTDLRADPSDGRARQQALTHTFPPKAIANCSYTVTAVMTYNGAECPETEVPVNVSSWSTDDVNGGEIKMGAPGIVADNAITIQFCEGSDIDLLLEDESTLNCQGGTNPNVPTRQREVSYNVTGGGGMPNVSVGGVQVTNTSGGDIQTDFTPLGVEDTGVITASFSGAAFQQITVPGGFGPGFPQVGDRFTVELRYWNLCNRAPAAPVTSRATIEIVESPDPPTLSDTLFCVGNTSGAYTITATASSVLSPLYTWYSPQGTAISFNRFFNPLNFSATISPNANGPGGSYPLRVTVSGRANNGTAALRCTSDTTRSTFRIYPRLDGRTLRWGSDSVSTTICTGTDPAAFTIPPATGGDGAYAYTWQQSTNGSSYADIAGATGVTYDPPSLTATTWFRRRVTSARNSRGASALCREGFSSVFRFDVEQPVTPGQVGNDQTICAGGSPPTRINSLAAPTGGRAPYVYAWESTTTDPATNPNPPVTAIANTNSPVYTPPRTLTTTTWYRRTVQDGACATAAAPTQATGWVRVNVISGVTAGTIAVSGGPSASSICSGAASPGITEVTPASGGTGTYNYQWLRADALNGPYSTIGGATSQAGYTPPQLTDTTYFVRSATSTGCTVFSDTVTIAVNELPTVSISGGGSICQGTAAPDVIITAQGGDAPWNVTYSYTPPAGTATQTPVSVGSAGDASDTHTISAPPEGTYALVSITDANGCSPTSVSGTATVNNAAGSNAPTVTSVTAGQPVCHIGSTTNPPDATIILSDPGTYNISYSLDGAAQPAASFSAAPNTNAIIIPVSYFFWGNQADTVAFALTQVTDNASGCSLTLPAQATANLVVNPTPVVDANQQADACSGVAASYRITMTGAPVGDTQFRWTRNGTTVTRNATDAAHITTMVDNKTLNMVVETYNVTPFTPHCTGAAVAVQLRVNPEPVIQPNQSAEACDGRTATHAILLDNAPAGTRVTWANPITNASTSRFVQFAPTIRDQLPNNTAQKVDTTYLYLVNAQSGAGCNSQQDTVRITIHPVPEFGVNNPKNICKNEPANYSITLSPPKTPSGVTFSWNDPSTGTRVTQPDGSTGALHITDRYATDAIRTYSVTATTSDQCSSSPTSIRINVNDDPTAVDVVKTVCEGITAAGVSGTGSAVINLEQENNNVGGSGVTVEWYASYASATGALSNRIQPGTASGETQNYQISSDGAVYAKIIAGSGASCSSVATLTLDYQSAPIPPTGSAINYVGQGVQTASGKYSVCLDSTAFHIFQAAQARRPTSQSTTVTYSWNFPSEAMLSAGTDSTQSALTLVFPEGQPTITDQDVAVTEYHNGCPGPVQTVQVSTDSRARKATITGPGVVCTGSTNNTYSANGPSGALYTWSLPTGMFFVTNSSQTTSDIRTDFTPNTINSVRDTLELNVKIETGQAKCVAEAADPDTIVLVQTPSMTSPNDTTVCSGVTAGQAITLTSSGGPPGTRYDWRINAIQGVSNVSVGDSDTGASGLDAVRALTNVSGVVGSVEYNVTPVGAPLASGGNSCRGSGQVVNITVNPEPVLATAQSTRVCSGKDVNYEIKLDPAGLPLGTVFSWPSPSAAAGIPAATNIAAGNAGTPHITDRIDNTSVSVNSFIYKVSPSNQGVTPNCAGSDRDVTVNINPEPVGTDATIAICSGQQLSYDLQANLDAAAAGGSGLSSTFSWSAADNSNVSGETVASSGAGAGVTIDDKLVNVTGVDQQVIYTVVPTNRFSSGQPACDGKSFTVTVTVRPEPVGQDDNISVCSGLALGYDLDNNLSTAGSGVTSGVAYTWTTSSNTSVTIAPGPTNASAINDTITNVTSSDQSIDYTVVPTYTDPAGNSCRGASFKLGIVIHPEPVGAPRTSTLCSQSSPNVGLQNIINGSGGNRVSSSFSWTGANNAAVGGITTSPSSSSVINDVLTNVTSNTEDVVYTVTPTSSASSCTGSDFTVTVSVNPQPVGKDTTMEICSSVQLAYDLQNTGINTGSGNRVPSTFSWVAASNSDVTGENISTQLTSIIEDKLKNITQAASTVTYTINPTSTTGSCVGDPFTLAVRVKPEPVGYNERISTCGGVALNYDLQAQNINDAAAGGNGLSSTFSWQATPNTNVSGLSTTAQSSSVINDNITNLSSTFQDVIYTVTPTAASNNCVGSAFTVTVQVNPQPQSTSGSAIICSGNSVNRNLSNSINNNIAASYEWQAAANANVTGESTVAQTSNIIGDQLTNVSSADQDVVYTVVPTSAAYGCEGASFMITVTVRPEPVGSSESNQICSNAALAYDLQANINKSNGVSSTFRWKSRTSEPSISGETTVEQSTNTIRDDLTNVSTSTGTLFYDITPTSTDNCEGDLFTLTLDVYPKPNANDATGLTLCDGQNVDFDLENHVNTSGNGLTATTTYDWVTTANNDVTGESTTKRRSNKIDDVLRLNTNIISNQAINYTVTPIEQTNGCTGDDFNVSLTLQPKPIGFAETVRICSELSPIFSLVNNIDSKGNAFSSNTTYEWQAADNPNVTGESLTVQTANVIDEKLVNTSTTTQTVVYTYTPSNSNGCVGDDVDITVNVEPSPIMDPSIAQKDICSDATGHLSTVGITLATTSGSIPAVGYDVTATVPTVANFSGTATTGNGLPANSISSDTYQNTSSTSVDVVYTVIPVSAGSCKGLPLDIRVAVNPKPVMNPNLDRSVCSGSASGITLSTNGVSVVANSYTLDRHALSTTNGVQEDPANATDGSSGSDALIAGDKYINTGNSDITIDYTIRPVSPKSAGSASGGCIGEQGVITLTVRPQPVLDDSPPPPVCSNVATGVVLTTLSSSVAATHYDLNGILRGSSLLRPGPSNASIGPRKLPDALKDDLFYNNTSGPLKVTYQLVPISGQNCVGDAANLEVTINPAPALATALDATVCSGDDSGIVFQTGSGVGASTYNISSITPAPGLTAASGNATTGTGFSSTEIQMDKFDNTTNDPQDVVYAVSGSSASGCAGNSIDVTLTVEPVITAVPNGRVVNICSDSNIDIELTSPSNPTSGDVTFNYTVTAPLGSGITGYVGSQSNLPENYSIASTLVNSADTPSSITYSIIAVANGARNGAGCRSPLPATLDVTVEPLPKLVTTPATQVVCEGTPTRLELTTTTTPSVGGIEFEVRSKTPTGGITQTGPSPVVNNYQSGDFLADTWDNPTLLYQTVDYVIRPKMTTGLFCEGRDTDLRITVRPNPEMTPVADLSVCSNAPLSIPLSFDLAGTYATWTPATPSSVSGVTAGGGTRIDATPINTSFNPAIVVYSVRPQLDACIGQPVDVRVQINPLPNTKGLPATTTVCNGQTLTVPLSSDVPGATDFEWTVLDTYGLGSPNQFDGSGTTISQLLDNTLGYQAILVYTVTPTSQFSCEGRSSFMNVEVTSIVPDISPNKTQLCSGETVQIVNTSLGATNHRWFYRLQGQTNELGVITSPSASYQLENNTSTNPIFYEVVYEASNGTCSKKGITTPPIAVYRSPLAQFDEGAVPPFRGGVSQVNFTNISDPIDDSQFRYEWNFGVESTPTNYVGSTPPTVNYNTKGDRDVLIRVVNNDAETAGLFCEDTFIKTIVIPAAPLLADFDIDQPTSCVPAEITITSLSTGDVNQWSVSDENGVVVYRSSSAVNPSFLITSSGEYTVSLTARDSFTGQLSSITKRFVAYESPLANFLARPTTVFVPDTELLIANSTDAANTYSWDFGDGTTSDLETPPPHKYAQEGSYDLKLIAGFDYGNGVVCRDTLIQRIRARSGGDVRIPNTFTPNTAFSPITGPGGGTGGSSGNPGVPGIVQPGIGGGSGSASGNFNDVFLPIVQGAESFNMQIYDRWGNLLFESNSATIGWDGRDTKGRLMPAGVYVYRLEIVLSDGNNITRVGDITMLR